MIATRRTQPHRKGQQRPGPALAAMKAGKPAYLPNPADVTRTAQKRARRRKRGALRRSLA